MFEQCEQCAREESSSSKTYNWRSGGVWDLHLSLEQLISAQMAQAVQVFAPGCIEQGLVGDVGRVARGTMARSSASYKGCQ